jgi:hypothetical protein
MRTSVVPDREALVIPLEAGSVMGTVEESDLVKVKTLPARLTLVKHTGSASAAAAMAEET